MFRGSFCLWTYVVLVGLSIPAASQDRPAPQKDTDVPGIKGWPMYGHDARHTCRTQIPGPAKAVVKWKKTFAGLVADNASPIVAPDGMIYLTASTRGLLAMTPAGQVRWHLWSDAMHIRMAAAPALGPDGALYVIRSQDPADMAKWPGNMDLLVALNRLTGALRWKVPIGRATYGSPTVGPDGTIYVGGTAPMKLPALPKIRPGRPPVLPPPPDPGKLGQETMLLALSPAGRPRWVWKGQRPGVWVESSPALSPSGDVFFHANGLGVYSVDTKGRQKWQNDEPGLGEAFNSASVASDGTAYIGSSNRAFYALSPDTGKTKWKAAVANWMYMSACAIGPQGQLLRGDNAGVFYCFKPGGELAWDFDTQTKGQIACAPALAGNGLVYFTEGKTTQALVEQGHLYALKVQNGELAWKYPIGWSTSSPVIGPDGSLIVVSCQSDSSNPANAQFTVYCFKP